MIEVGTHSVVKTENQISSNRYQVPSCATVTEKENRDGGDYKLEISQKAREKAESSKTAKSSEEPGESGEKTISWQDVREVIENSREESRRQLLELLRHLGPEREKPGSETDLQPEFFPSDPSLPVEPQDPQDLKTVENAEEDQNTEIDGYWSAENTSDRIVNFAMQFAGMNGEDPEGFVETIRNAVEDGFSQAYALTGPLPGAAGKLSAETHRLTFEKLDARLADWKSTLYNQAAT